MAMPGDLVDALRGVVGAAHVHTAGQEVDALSTDWRGLRRGRPLCLVLPATTGEVAAVVRLCAAAAVGIVPQGGNTSMVAGATPDASGRQVLLSLRRMARIRDIDPLDMTMTAEAGLIVAAAQEAAARVDCTFPLSFSADGSAMLGGVLSTNAGGNNTIRYGNARDMVLGLEVVLPDGRIWNGLRRLRKDNTGYALRHLFAGAEGTLGIITAAVIALHPANRSIETAFCAIPDIPAALALLRRCRQAADTALRSFEYISSTALTLALDRIEGLRLPLTETAPHYVLIDLAAPSTGTALRETIESILAAAFEAGEVTDAVLAESGAQARALWRLREDLSEAQRLSGANVKNDVSVPVARVPDLLTQGTAAVAALMPGARVAPFGHLGDGNIHFNVVRPEAMTDAGFTAQSDTIVAAVTSVVRALDGSFSAEHGIGTIKTGLLHDWRTGPELDLMRAIKATIDPEGIMNPGVVFSPAAARS